MKARIVSLHCYPLKSGRAVDQTAARLTTRGFAFDREWLVITPEGRFLTQRELPLLARLVAVVDATVLRLAFDDAIFDVPLDCGPASRAVRIWDSECLGRDCGDAVAAWLGQYLQRTVRLVRFDDARPRESDQRWTSDMVALNAYSDGFPLLVANLASLADLNARLAQPLPMNRFRPNIVIDGIAAFAEDRVAELRTAGVCLRLVKPCTRCAITTTDQISGARTSDEPLRTLREYRLDRKLQGVTFAQNAIIATGIGAQLHVGEQLEVVFRPPADR